MAVSAQGFNPVFLPMFLSKIQQDANVLITLHLVFARFDRKPQESVARGHEFPGQVSFL